jgi:hypothetical protein
MLLSALASLPLTALSLPQKEYGKEYGEVRVVIDDRGVVKVEYLTLSANGVLVVWGPRWAFEPCNYQLNWSPGILEDNTLLGKVACNFGNLTWRERFWLKEDAAILEFELAAASDVYSERMAWRLELPVESFAGSYVTAITSGGSLSNVSLSPAVGRSGGSYEGVGWIVPFGPLPKGFVVVGFSDSCQFVGLELVDERAWGAPLYSARMYPAPGALAWKPGNRLRFVICIYPFNDPMQREAALKLARSLALLLEYRGIIGLSFDDLTKLLVNGKVVEEAERRASWLRLVQGLYIGGVAALVVTLSVVLVIRHRKRKRGAKSLK